MKQRLGIAQALLCRPKLLICDEPTSALDPVGRKEILDILQAVKEQTTVLFSTHILSDVERICTDIAFLHDGVVCMQGKLSDLKNGKRTEEYRIETEREADAKVLAETIPGCTLSGERKLLFREDSITVFELMRFLADREIMLIGLERMEPSLEALFMEVVKK